MKKIFIVWGREAALSRGITDALGAEFKQVYINKIGPLKIPAFFRYIIQGFWTIGILAWNRPKVLIVQNPPIFAPFLVLIYSKVFRAKLMIDSHTAAFWDKKWMNFYWLFKFVARRADLNTCHNFKNLEILQKWEVEPCMVLQFVNPVYDNLENIKIEPELAKILTKYKFSVMMVNRFEIDDDWKNTIKTAELMPETVFFITGDLSKISQKNVKKPKNVIFTNYLKHNEFIKLMSQVTAVIALTKRRDTVLWSIREIMALRKPFVTTDSEVLRHYFGDLAEFTNHDPEDMKVKLEKAIKEEKEIKNKIDKFLEQDQKRWEREISEVKKILEIE